MQEAHLTRLVLAYWLDQVFLSASLTPLGVVIKVQIFYFSGLRHFLEGLSEKQFIQFSPTIGSIGTLTKRQNIKLSKFLEFIPKGSFLAVNSLVILQG